MARLLWRADVLTDTWHVVAAGTCQHVKNGRSGPFEHVGNDHLLGIEAQHADRSAASRRSAVRGS